MIPVFWRMKHVFMFLYNLLPVLFAFTALDRHKRELNLRSQFQTKRANSYHKIYRTKTNPVHNLTKTKANHVPHTTISGICCLFLLLLFYLFFFAPDLVPFFRLIACSTTSLGTCFPVLPTRCRLVGGGHETMLQ